LLLDPPPSATGSPSMKNRTSRRPLAKLITNSFSALISVFPVALSSLSLTLSSDSTTTSVVLTEPSILNCTLTVGLSGLSFRALSQAGGECRRRVDGGLVHLGPEAELDDVGHSGTSACRCATSRRSAPRFEESKSIFTPRSVVTGGA
jgi:hypothetical protein